MSFGSRLIAIRERRDFTQVALAKASSLDPTQIAHFEADAREPSAKNIRKLAKALDVTADYLLELTSNTFRLNGSR